MLVSQAIGAASARLGTRAAFGLAGSGNLLLINAMRDSGMAYHAACHEAAAVAMADGYARLTGEVGVATVHQGPGFTNTLTALREAVRSHTPLVLLAAESAAGARGSQSVDQSALAAAVGAGMSRLAAGSDPVRVVAEAFARARAGRRPIAVMLPVDVQRALYPPGEVNPVLAAPVPCAVPGPGALAKADAAIARARRPLILAGRGAAEAGPQLRELAERTGALLATTIVAKGLFAGDAYDIGSLGGFASPLAAELAASADVVLVFGSSLDPWATCGGRLWSPQARLLRVDDREVPGAAVMGDAKAVAERLSDSAAQTWRTSAMAARIAAARQQDRAVPGTVAGLDPRSLAIRLDEMLPADRIVSVDSGHFMAFPARFVGAEGGRSFVFAQGFQAVGLALGVGIGAAAGGGGRITVVFAGDGGAQMSLLELDTAVRYRLPLLLVIFDDGGYGAEFHDFEPHGIPCDVARFPRRDFAAIARALGAQAAVAGSPDDLAALSGWLAQPEGPFVLDCKVDPGVDAVSVLSEIGAAEWSMPTPASLAQDRERGTC